MSTRPVSKSIMSGNLKEGTSCATELLRFWVFGGHDYYPCGGMEDFKESFADRDKAIEHANSLVSRLDGDWAHVYDTEDDYVVHVAPRQGCEG